MLAMSTPPGSTGSSRLALYLAIGYTLLIVYASLSPFTGWRSPGPTPLAFLYAPLPRYVTGFDLAVNVIAYVPEGFLVTLLILGAARPAAAAIAGTLACCALSLAMEVAQTYLPMRVANNLDLLTNGVGALVGAVLAARAGSLPTFVERLMRWRAALFLHGRSADFGVSLLALWFFSQLDPSRPLLGILFFSDGVQAQLAGLAPAQSYKLLGPLSVALNLVGVGLVLMCVMQSRRMALAAVGLLVVVASLIKMVAATLLLKREAAFLWVSQEVAAAIACGAIVLTFAAAMPRRWVAPLCAMSMIAAIGLAVFKPDEPFAVLALRLFRWSDVQLLNYNGLASAVADAWPYAALAMLFMLRRRAPADTLQARTPRIDTRT
jgi:VanZ family protein